MTSLCVLYQNRLPDLEQHRYMLRVPLHVPHAERITFQGAIAISWYFCKPPKPERWHIPLL